MNTILPISNMAMRIAADAADLSLIDINYLMTHFSKEIGIREELIRRNARKEIKAISLRAGIAVIFPDDFSCFYRSESNRIAIENSAQQCECRCFYQDIAVESLPALFSRKRNEQLSGGK